MAEILTEEDFKALREAQERLRHRALVAPSGAPMAAAAQVFRPVGAQADVELVHRCEGGCHGVVDRRGGWCPTCAEAGRRRARELEVAVARETWSPGGAMAWCRANDPRYAEATAKAAAAVPREAARLVTQAAWTRDTGSVLLIGPTDFGKTRVLGAIGNRVLDYAIKLGASRPEPKPGEDPRETAAAHRLRVEDAMRFARGVRYVSALDLGRARSQSKFEEPEIVRMAKGATLLLLDEVGWEESRFDPSAVRDILRARFDPVWKPTIAASGKTWPELVERYGEPTLRMLTCKGVLIDLHPRKAA